METNTFYATFEGEIAGSWRKVGAPIQMTEEQAKYMLLAGNISRTPPKKTTTKASKTVAGGNDKRRN